MGVGFYGLLQRRHVRQHAAVFVGVLDGFDLRLVVLAGADLVPDVPPGSPGDHPLADLLVGPLLGRASGPDGLLPGPEQPLQLAHDRAGELGDRDPG